MSFDSRQFRDALGRFATGVCVITAKPDNAPAMGMTVNSFASVSLDPPLVLWSIQKNSECFGVFDTVERYTINVLTKEQQALSNQYAKKGAHDLTPEHFRIGRSGAPVLRNCLANFECQIESRLDGGDHVILLGRVLEVESAPNGAPLLFFSGKYRELH